MKLTLSVLMIAAGIVRASGDAVSCSVIDYLYYSSDCCDGSNSVQCMESIPQTDKAAIDNLASLKRPEGAACESGDSIKFLNSKIVCTTADSCLIPCVNGNITGTVGSCACACNAGFSGADCSTADPTTTAAAATTAAPAATTTTTAAPAAPAGGAPNGYTKTENNLCNGAQLDPLTVDTTGVTTVQGCADVCNTKEECKAFNVDKTTNACVVRYACDSPTVDNSQDAYVFDQYDANEYKTSYSDTTYTAQYGAATPLTQAECEIYTIGGINAGQITGPAMVVLNDDTTPAHCLLGSDGKVYFQQKSDSSTLLDGGNAVPYQAIVKQNCHDRGDCVIGTGCADLWACADGACISNACAAPQANGATCSGNDDCQNACISSTGKCGDPQADGATCADKDECANTCLSATNQCGAALPNNAACGSWSDCTSENCDNNVCAP